MIVRSQKNRIIGAILMSTVSIPLFTEKAPYSVFAFWPSAMTNHQGFELQMSRANFHGRKDVRTIERWLHFWLLRKLYI